MAVTSDIGPFPIQFEVAVSFAATIAAPPGAGKIVAAEWDLEGTGDYADKAAVSPSETVGLSASHAYAKSGTYFAVLRAALQREGDGDTPYARVQNLAQVRIVVT